MKKVVGFLLLVIVALLVWGVVVEPRLIDTERYIVEIPELPAEWEGETIGLIADWQLGMWLDNDGTVRRIVEELVEQEPAAVLVAGDFLYQPVQNGAEELIAAAVEIIRPLPEAGIPTLVVLGDHDYGQAGEPNPAVAEALTAALEAVGVEVLHNEAVPLEDDQPEDVESEVAGEDDDLYLVGIDPLILNLADVDAALAQVPAGAPHLALMHNPDIFKRFPANSASLAMAGHTHGGQVRVPGFPEWSWLALVQGGEVTADGWIDDYGAPGNRLYVNRGIGFSIVPIRLFCPPELTLFTLEAAE